MLIDESSGENCKAEISLSGWRALVSGALAGCACWASVFPADVVKTHLQCGELYKFPSKMLDGGF